jgi:hypothetical protein
MNKPAATLSLVVLAAAACGGIWYLLRSGPAREREPASLPVAETAPAALEGAAPAVAAPLDREEAAEAPAGLVAPASTGQERRALDIGGGARSVRGRVAFPANAPQDPTLRVLALSKDLEAEKIYGSDGVIAKLAQGEEPEELLASAAVDGAGDFELALPAEAKAAWLAIDGRFLYANEATPVDLATGATPALPAKLGGCIQGRVQLPRGTQASPESLRKLEIELDPDGGNFSMFALEATPLFERPAFADEHGNFELRAIDATHGYELSVESEAAADWSQGALRLDEGLVLPVDVQLLVGASLRGRVIGADGRGVSGAKVTAAEAAMWGFPGKALAEAETDAQGDFVLEHVPAGKSLLIAKLEGYLESEAQKLDLADGAEYDALTLALDEGDSISGTVRFEDGTAAASSEVKVSFDPAAMMGMGAMNAARGGSGKGKADAEGRFSVRGLGKGPFVVEASLARSGGAAATAARTSGAAS